MPKFELYFSLDAEGNSAISLDGADAAHDACAEYDAGPVRTVCLSLDAELPADDTDEDDVTVVDVLVPPQASEDQENEEAEADEARLPAEDDEDVPAEVHAPTEHPAATEITA